ncbi:MAG: DUF2244 domain-containing protein [Hyphomicrobiaceae bacterium]
MTDNMPEAASTAKPQPFTAVLTPHRSLSPSGFLIMMVAIGVVSFIVGFAFLWMGAWPVFGFLGLDVALIYWAFKQNYRDGHASETIEVSPHQVRLTRYDPNGNASAFNFNTYWVRLALDERSDGRSILTLVNRNERVRFADFLSDVERREFADVLASELVQARSRTGF